MPRGPRIDAPGLLHHVRARGVNRRRIFLSDGDREDFLIRLNRVCEEHGAEVFGWCLMSNHFHLAIRTGKRPLAKTMTSVLTGYAMGFNKIHRRSGHLFQNRYKSTIVEEEKYFLALIRYIHRNPLRARIVKSIEELRTYPWTGHSVLMGTNKQEFQDASPVLVHFGKRVGSARKELVAFMTSGEAKKEESFFKGGGLVRSIGGPENLREHRKGPKWAYDERILGEGAFVEAVLKNVATQNKYQALSKEQKWELFQKLLESLCEQYEIKPAELLAVSKRRKVSEVRSLLTYGAHRELGLSAAEIGRVLNVSGQTVMKGASRAEETWESLDWIMEGIKV